MFNQSYATQSILNKNILAGIKEQPVLSPKTQKARGIINGVKPFLYKYDRYDDLSIRALPIYDLIKTDIDIDELDEKYALDSFVRPCPSQPRHGFVNSKVLTGGKTELKSILRKVKELDKKGEILITQFIKADCSAVYSINGLLSIGPNNDGATSGKDSFSLPLCPQNLTKTILKRAGIKDENTFIEFVHDNYMKQVVLTQIRGGPKTPINNNYIPKTLKIKHIVKPDGDLVAWEKKVKTFEPGTVVYGGIGNTLASHAAIHCVLNKIPFITSFKPFVGQKVLKSERNDFKLNHKEFKTGVSVAIKEKESLSVMLDFSAMVIHNWPYLRGSEHASWLLGLASVYMSKILCALCLGEFRHFDIKFFRKGRDIIYISAVENIGISMLQLPAAMKIFSRKADDAGYGGKTWALASKICISIWNNILNIYSKPKNTKALISLLNKSLNLVHNNGCLFDKFADTKLLDAFAEDPGILTSFNFPLLFEKKNKVFKKEKLLTSIGERVEKL